MDERLLSIHACTRSGDTFEHLLCAGCHVRNGDMCEPPQLVAFGTGDASKLALCVGRWRKLKETNKGKTIGLGTN